MSKRDEKTLECTTCSALWKKQGTTYCWSDPTAKPGMPGYCPSQSEAEVIEESFKKYTGDDEEARLAKVAAVVEGLCYQPVPGSEAVNARWTRVEDTIALAGLMGWKKIGIASCIGLLDESERLADILRAQGFEPLSVCCKAGSIDKLELGLQEENKVRPGTFEPACNPVAQAKMLDAAGAEMNIIVGLCVGHDMLFSRYSKAPVTTLVVKDRVTGHNPVAVLYGQNFYYKRLQKQKVLGETGKGPNAGQTEKNSEENKE
ncbi:Uncharacterized metal-binding protein [Geoalkalibacter ferrihydriticus]|uniref:Uncharacterized metal-binding protein n=1 Tax=Geoalkalibacter ferrihydriticus TaxID=392333 RepID=A0A1G9SA53_9BACT|nr:DUF1847 domain-containing protein [Geoalkalibacter ferrihydriticus]SDM32349.1 Uncharacterized metal-binding protein [Geoalkalibacter ferrihydriticus]